MIEELRAQLAVAQDHLTIAENAGQEHRAQLYRSRIEDLVEIAMRHGVDLARLNGDASRADRSATGGTSTTG